MKNAVIVLSIVCVALAGVAWNQHSSAHKQSKVALVESARLSNQCEQINLKLTEQTGVNTTLLTNLAKRTEELAAMSNQIVRLKTTLAKAEEAVEATRAEVEERDGRINDWQTSHAELAAKANELNSSLGTVELEIAGVKKRLDASEGDRAFLLKELKRLQLEKEKLDRQFHDLAAIRAQFERLKNDKVINRRFSWADTTLVRPEYKGAEMLAAGEDGPRTKSRYGLKVELQQDGSVRLVPATGNVR